MDPLAYFLAQDRNALLDENDQLKLHLQVSDAQKLQISREERARSRLVGIQQIEIQRLEEENARQHRLLRIQARALHGYQRDLDSIQRKSTRETESKTGDKRKRSKEEIRDAFNRNVRNTRQLTGRLTNARRQIYGPDDGTGLVIMDRRQSEYLNMISDSNASSSDTEPDDFPVLV